MDRGVVGGVGLPEELPLPPEQPQRNAAPMHIAIRTRGAARRRGVAHGMTRRSSLKPQGLKFRPTVAVSLSPWLTS